MLPLLGAIQRRAELWNAYGVRTWHPKSVHRVIDDIVLRYNKFDAEHDDFVEAVCSRIEVSNYPPWNELPEAQAIIFSLMFQTRGMHLGRVFISRMAPGITIPPHTDRIAEAEAEFPVRTIPALYYNRYHVTLASSPGCVFRCGDEQVSMRPGEVWFFRNELIHEVVNNSADDRISLVIDIHSPDGIYYPPLARPEGSAG